MESVGGDAQRGLVVEAPPSAPLEVAEPDLLLELLIVALDAPAQLGDIDQLADRDVMWKGREPVFGRLLLTFRPLDQQPLFRPAFGEHVIMMCGTNTHASKARGQPFSAPLPPLDRAPGPLRQADREVLDGNRLMLAIPAHELRYAPVARPLFWRQRCRARRPHGRVRQDAGDILQPQSADAG